MSIESLIETARNRYVRFFIDAREQKRRENPRTVSELLISLSTEDLSYPYRYLRVDLLANDSSDNPEPSEISLPPEKLEPTGFNFGDFVVEAYPFSWCAIELLLDSEPTNKKQLEGWMTRWLDVQDQNARTSDDLSLAAHSFSPIQKTGDWWSLVADFGTAPADALVELIELFVGQGVRRLVLKAAV
jgi:hypothetical protein